MAKERKPVLAPSRPTDSGRLRFYCLVKGSWDRFPGVVVGCRMAGDNDRSFTRAEKVMSVEEGRRLAKQINEACDIVEHDKTP